MMAMPLGEESVGTAALTMTLKMVEKNQNLAGLIIRVLVEPGVAFGLVKGLDVV